ncbi:MAG: tRNA pseudouridine(55) synthase TruB [Oscillospiraceae bacterium]|jgi:tRNA pseudouridine55 synthase|nr:tRNA pseudouridine(55) synthase TruB [Oscillospiraceae bacterium]
MIKSGIIIINKAAGMSSHKVVSCCRRILGEKKIGHGGTLDPMATGVLPIFIRRATRASGLLLESDKSYTAAFRTGVTTDTQDITGKVLSVSSHTPPDNEVAEILISFTGRQRQIPPMYSALKVDGKKLYEIAREGGEVERKPRDIEIYSIAYLGKRGGDHVISVACSKGTYIRTLVHDIGAALGCGAALTGLERTKAGPFSIKDAVTLEELEAVSRSGGVEDIIISTDKMFSEYDRLTIDPDGERLCRYGAVVPYGNVTSALPGHDGLVGRKLRVYSVTGEFLMLSLGTPEGLKTEKSFFEI